MPPKAKYTKEEIVDAAIGIIERDGMEKLTARTLGAELGGSARPIFTVFKSMDEMNAAVFERVKGIYGAAVEVGLKKSPAFKGAGEAYIGFAAARPRLFQMLFMRERAARPDRKTVLALIEEHYDAILKSITDGYGVSVETAEELYFNMWVYSHGIAVLLATGVCGFSSEQISAYLTDVFTAFIKKIKSEERK